MLAYVRGPMVWIALLVFVLGTAVQILRFFLLTRKAALSVSVPTQLQKKPARKKPAFERMTDIVYQLKDTVFAVHPLTMAVSTLFHVCLVLLPLFVMAHNEMIELVIGVSLPSLSEGLSDGLTLIVLFCCVFFLIRRVSLARMRAISSLADYMVLALATIPFLSGFLAYHQIFDYQTMMIVHMLSGELMLIIIPFTKLVHMIFFFFNRFLVINEHTLGRGKRVW
jgi:nitrate reductase gamma subunit